MRDAITIAVAKGRVLDDALPLLSAAGIGIGSDVQTSRKLIVPTATDGVRIVIVRAADVPAFVRFGAADLGITGKDILLEQRADLYELVDLGIARCRMVVAQAADVPDFEHFGPADFGIIGKDIPLKQHDDLYGLGNLDIAKYRMVMMAQALDAASDRRPLRVATKYVNTAREFFAARGEQVEIIRLYGSMELAPLTGLAERIVDLVASGRTLQANGLVATDTIADISARLVANKAAVRLKRAPLSAVVDALAAAAA